ncbi:hypothetical protein GCM10023142_14460 [Anaerocolumna aminovalerica]|uniref:Lipoprotein n=1 Tax=Anaerocolumna aminovalerica TaxID=1527 RepID=A0A1I5F8J2_9FIRM|nr:MULTISPECIES: hypothetical protein [Bacillota]MBU5334035.1 hypothetical protein [Anaerocolumna aminovalerica]MDU6266236.1 hypothetical protein [Anaerocolumna aminovalerica]SFO19631.1 hypothetical protein SAMN04489757_11286 [Anaerocolumna aminovalerica]
MREIKIVIIFIVLLITLVGCSKQDENQFTKSNTYESYDGEKAVQTNKNDDKHITETIDVNMKIDADVIAPNSDEYFEYQLVEKDFDIEKFSQLLFENDSSIKKTLEDLPNPYIKSIIETENGGQLVIWPNSLRFQSDSRMQNIEYLIGSKFYWEIDNKNYTDEELQKFIQNEQVKYNMERFEETYELGDNERLELVTAIEVTAESLIQEQNSLSQRPGYDEEVKSGMREIVDDWTGVEKLYYLEYNIIQNSIPMFGKKEALIQSSFAGASYQSSYISIILSDKGFEYLDIQGAWKVESADKIEIISAKKGIEKLKEKYANLIVSTESNISKIWLEYIFIPNEHDESNSTGKLTPYWCYQRQYTDGVNEEGVTFYTYQADRINAVTGGDLAYGN